LLKAVLIDDEKLAIERLKRLLKNFENEIIIIGTAENGIDGVDIVNRLNPDLIFLDIQMPGLNGFQMLEKLNCSPWVIFCTAYDEYAIDAFKTNSIDYLLKPVSGKMLEASIQKLRSYENKTLKMEELKNIFYQMNQPDMDYYKVKVKDKIIFLKNDEIYYFQASDKYVEVFALQGNFLISDTLNQLENVLPERVFVRIHRSVIINRNFISEIIRFGMNSFRVKMRDKKQTVLPLSRDLKWKLDI